MAAAAPAAQGVAAAPANGSGAPAAAREAAEEALKAFIKSLLDDDQVGAEVAGAKQTVYLLTVSRVLPETLLANDLRDIAALTRQQLAECIIDAFNNPVAGAQGGRPRSNAQRLMKLAVFRETHASGEPHFHAAVKLSTHLTFAAAKRTLRQRHRVACHFSRSHREWRSALRYGPLRGRKPQFEMRGCAL